MIDKNKISDYNLTIDNQSMIEKSYKIYSYDEEERI